MAVLFGGVVGIRPWDGLFDYECVLAAVGFSLESDEPAVVDGAVDGGGGHVGVAWYPAPAAELDVGGVDDAPCLVAVGDDLEEQAAAFLVDGHVAEFIDDDQPRLADGGEFVVEPVVVLGAAKAHEQVAGGEEAHRDVVQTCEASDGDGEVGLAASNVAVEDEVLGVLDELEALELATPPVGGHFENEINNGMPNKPTFVEDFCHRLSQDWNQCGRGGVAERYLKEETNKFIQFEGDSKQYLLPDFERAARIAEFGGYMEDARREKRPLALSIEDCPQLDAQHGIHRYEEHLDEQRATNRRNVRGRVWKKILFAFVCLIVACGVEWILDELQEVVTRTGIFSGILPDWAWNIIEMVVFLLVAEFVTDMISKSFPNMMSLPKALDSMFHWFGDLAGVGTRTSTYCTPDEADSVTTKHKPRYYVERCNAARPVDVVIPYALKQYVALWRKEREQNNPGTCRAVMLGSTRHLTRRSR